MNRRKLLRWSSGTLSTILAGCVGDNTGSGNGEKNNGDESSSSNGSGGKARFEVDSLDMPYKVEVGQEWAWSLTVANTGDADGTFETPVYVKTPDTEFTEISTIELEIAAGETATYESDTSGIRYLTRATYRFEALNLEHEVLAVLRSLVFGEPYESPLAIETTAHSIDLRDDYSYEGYYGDTETEEASSGNQWAFLEFEATNKSGSSGWLPLESDVTLLAGNSQYDITYVRKENGKYEGGEVQAGVTRRGWIAYEVPNDLTVDDLEVAYSNSDSQGEWSVRWQSGEIAQSYFSI